MPDLDDAVKQCIHTLSDKDLIKMLTASPDEYLPKALAFASNEAQHRGLTDISVDATKRIDAEEQCQVEESEEPPSWLTAKQKEIYKIRMSSSFGQAKLFGLIGCLFSLFALLPISELTDSITVQSEGQVRVGIVLLCMGGGLYFIMLDGLSLEQYALDKLEGVNKWINIGAWAVAIPMVVLGGWLLIRNGA